MAVSITINTLEEIKKNEEEEEEEGVGEKKGEKKKKKKKNHFEFEMRTIRDCSLSELIPNKAVATRGTLSIDGPRSSSPAASDGSTNVGQLPARYVSPLPHDSAVVDVTSDSRS